ncbi:MAG: RNA polymerase factor sigma-70 [Lachnospiraceae bacterium]|nr:RNA polymerase factor sigma-70 [Lachnospiraceae bacterium]
MENKYSTDSDEELICRLRDGEQEITEYILDKYKNMVKAKAGTMFILGADKEDLIQEGMIGLFKAIRDYDPGRDASFATFADLCVSRQMYTAVTASGRQKHIPLNNYVSLCVMEDGEGDPRELIDSSFAGSDGSDPESVIIAKEGIAAVEKCIETELSSFEKQTIELYLAGFGYVDIARILGKDEKSTDNALQRAKGKLRKNLKI